MQHILNIISNKYHMPSSISTTNPNQKDLFFFESKTNTKLKKLVINNCPSNFIGFSLDDNFPFSSYFNPDTEMINKKCDIILLSPDKIILIDAKSDSIDYSNVQKQLDSTKYFVSYLLDLANYLNPTINIDIPIYMCVVKTGVPEKNQLCLQHQKKLNFKIFQKQPKNKEVQISLSEILKKFGI